MINIDAGAAVDLGHLVGARVIARQALDRAVEHQELEAEEIGQPAAPAPEGLGKLAKMQIDRVLAGARQLLVIGDAQGVVAERVLELLDHRDVLPAMGEAEDLDARPRALILALGDGLLQRREPRPLRRAHRPIGRIIGGGLAIDGARGVTKHELARGDGGDRGRGEQPRARRRGPEHHEDAGRRDGEAGEDFAQRIGACGPP